MDRGGHVGPEDDVDPVGLEQAADDERLGLISHAGYLPEGTVAGALRWWPPERDDTTGHQPLPMLRA
jgi:hypothetical protein